MFTFFDTAEERKLKIKDSCFLCLKPGHIANKCFSNKVCYHCGRKRHHHRSLCLKKFGNLTEKEDTPSSASRETKHFIKDFQPEINQKSQKEVSENLQHEPKLEHEAQLLNNRKQNENDHEKIQDLKQQLDQIISELAESKATIMEIKGKIRLSSIESHQSSKQTVTKHNNLFSLEA